MVIAFLRRWEEYEARKDLEREALNDEIIDLARYLARIANDEDSTALFDEVRKTLRGLQINFLHVFS